MPKDHVDPKVTTRVKTLLAQKFKLVTRITIIDIELNRIVLSGGSDLPEAEPIEMTSSSDTPEDQEAEEHDGNKNDKSLDLIVYDLLIKNSFSLKDLVAEILRSGYKTKSKNFSLVVQQVIQRLTKASAIKRDSKTRMYQGIKLNPELLKQRLSQQNKVRRREQTDKD